MEENEEKDDGQKYWWSDKPKGTTVAVAVVIFPIILAYWGFALVAKKAMIQHNNRRFVKIVGRPKNDIEDLLYKMDLDRKFGI